MASQSFRHVALTCLLGLILFSSKIAADDRAADDRTISVPEILSTAKLTPNAALVAETTKKLQDAKQNGSTDPQVLYAYALVLGTLGKPSTGTTVLDEIAGKLEGELRIAANLSVAWGALDQRKFPLALKHLKAIGRNLSETSPANGPFASEVVAQCGRMFAYLAGPLEETRIIGLEQAQSEFSEALTDPLRQTFENAYQDTIARYEGLRQERDDSRLADEQQLADRDARLHADRDAAKSDLERERSELEKRTDAARSELGQVKGALDQQYANDVSRLAALEQRLASLNFDIDRLQNQIDRCWAIRRDPDGNEVRVCVDRVRADRYERQIADNRRTIVAIQLEMSNLAGRGRLREQQRMQLAAGANAAANDLARRNAELKRKESQLQRTSSNAPRRSAPSTKTNTLSRRLTALREYVDSPYSWASDHLLAQVETSDQTKE